MLKEACWGHRWKHGDQEGGSSSNSGERGWGLEQDSSHRGGGKATLGPTLMGPMHVGEEGRKIMGDAWGIF